MSLKKTKVTFPCGAWKSAFLTAYPTLQYFGGAVWTEETAMEVMDMGVVAEGIVLKAFTVRVSRRWGGDG